MEDNNRWAKWFNNEIPDDAVKGEADFETFAKIKKYSSQLQSPEFDERALFQKIENQTFSKTEKSKFWGLKIAAVFIVLIGIGALVIFANSTTIASGTEAMVFQLPDNSEVQLSPNSKVEYNTLLWKYNRDIKLEGKAYFDVAHGRNFSVETNTAKVEVLGTRFEVDASSEKFQVTCFEGKIRVTSTENKQILQANQSLLLKNSKLISRENLNLYPTWILKNKAFEKADFSDILKELEKVYNVSLSTENLNIQKRFTGELPLNRLEVALKILSETYGLKIEKRSENSFIFVEYAKANQS
ncbi:FecR family protein [Psychroflexus aestuariivivens]|uniref:FecR family protein n=1 Tax=Psychroflexus aestuariivivens TaxID=1795040 RepID=UPI000FDC5FF4|nr:FecR family protein [Psychroflexus aestuariivivens]